MVEAITLVLVAAGGIALPIYGSLDGTVVLNNPRIDDALQYGADFTFPGVAYLSVRGSCPSVNGSTTCDLTVMVATTSAGGGPNYDLATKAITLELLASPFSQLAIASGLNAFPVQASYIIANRDSSDKTATISMPAVRAGATWYWDFLVLNPPIINGKPYLNLVIGAQLAPTAFVGHGYDVQAEISLPVS